MSTQAKPLTLEDLAALTKRHRPRFTKEQVLRALQYQRDNNCTLAVAAATEGMTNQTLATRRDQLYAEMEAEAQGKVATAPKQAAKPAAKKR